ncbi:MAG: T9SS type A sorting domain-containing protein [Saprospiraceae bacterium]
MSDIQVASEPVGEVYFTLYGTEQGGIYKGSTTEGWTNIYPSPTMRCLLIAPYDNNVLYAGSSYAWYRGFYNPASEGVLVSVNGGTTWQQASSDMPWTVATTLAMKSGDHPEVWVGSPGTGFQYAPALQMPVATHTIGEMLSQPIVYPNPTNGVIHLAWPTSFLGNTTLSIKDMTGHTVWQQTFESHQHPSVVVLPAHLPTGIYGLQIAGGNHGSIQRILLLRP